MKNRRAEDYMKVIYRLSEKGFVRGVDIARELNVKKPTVSVALKKLEAQGLVTFPSDRGVALTQEGEKIARGVIEKYNTLYSLLLELGVDEQTAYADACYMEHGISDATLAALKELLHYRQNVPYPPGSP